MPSVADVALPPELLLEQDGFVAIITINRPAKLNTVTAAMGRAFHQLCEAINDDDDVRVVVLTGAGDRAFSAGSDVDALADYGTSWRLRNRADYARAVGNIRKPVIAKIRGYCIGGGLEMAVLSDIRVCNDAATFAAGEVKLGWHGGAGNTQLLPRLLPPGIAAEMLFTGARMDAQRAQLHGLVNTVCPDNELDAAVDQLAAEIARNPPIAVQLSKHLIKVALSTSVDVGLAYENDTFTYVLSTRDAEEGRQAFSEKRSPIFKGE